MRNVRIAAVAVTVALLAALALTSTFAGESKGKDGVTVCGAELGKSPAVGLEQVMKYPEKYVGKTVIVTGVVEEVCQKKGCWMEVATTPGKPGVRVTFKDYGFFVPKDAHGMRFRAEGVFEMKTLDKEHAEHLMAEGAKIQLNDDGTADELGFVATGVELKKAGKDKKKEKSG